MREPGRPSSDGVCPAPSASAHLTASPDQSVHASVSAPAPVNIREALTMAQAGLRWLAECDATDLPTIAQADCLRGLERAASLHAAARARILAAFTARRGYVDDAQRSARGWLAWQTRITSSAAAAAVAAMRQLSAHPNVALALSAGQVSPSWGRQICDWTDSLPEETRDDADAILLAAADGGADLRDLDSLADQMRRRLAAPDRDDGRGFEDRTLRLATTFRGAGKIDGDLTPACTAAVRAVLDALGKRVGPEDDRSVGQRQHDALEEACRRLIASGFLPDRAGQPTQIQLHMTIDDLLNRAGGDHGSPEGPAASPGSACDATIVPVVSGRVDYELLRTLARRASADLATDPGRSPAGHPGSGALAGTRALATAGSPDPADRAASTASVSPASDRAGRTERSLRELILNQAVALLSGPDRLASWLRTGRLSGPAASASLPLDVGAATDSIPAHVRRAVILRDRHCAAPGCDQPPAACQIHHIVPRSEGGPASLSNLLLLCSFHHLILIHRWGWTIRLHADGSTTATSPDGRILHGHGPPAPAA